MYLRLCTFGILAAMVSSLSACYGVPGEGGSSGGGEPFVLGEPPVLLHGGNINDTGQTRFSDAGLPPADPGGTLLDVEPSSLPGQDGSYGRDVLDNRPDDGRAGFSFTRVDGEGNYTASSTAAECVKDNVTGLLWEIKHPYDTQWLDIRAKNVTVSWYQPDPAINGGDPGNPSYGYVINGVYTNTLAYVNYIRSISLCGQTDWRLPTFKELMSLVDFGDVRDCGVAVCPRIDIRYFPNTRATVYWTSVPEVGSPSRAFMVHFALGGGHSITKQGDASVRLVSDW